MWIELHDTLRGHPKTYALANTLKIKQYAAVGLMTCLWTWAVNNAPNGDLSQFPEAAIARECYWEKNPQILIDALISCGWLDEGMQIHDWNEYAGRMIEKRAQNANRMRASRARATHVTRTDDARAGATVPNSTVHNSTVHNEEGEKPRTARFAPPSLEDVQAYCAERGNGIDAQTFVDFYTGKGWMIGKNKMKDWKASVRTWEQKRSGERQPQGQTKGYSNPFVDLARQYEEAGE